MAMGHQLRSNEFSLIFEAGGSQRGITFSPLSINKLNFTLFKDRNRKVLKEEHCGQRGGGEYVLGSESPTFSSFFTCLITHPVT